MENELPEVLTIDDLRASLVKFYRSMDIPCTMHEIVEMLKKEFAEYLDCGCGFCMLKAGGAAEAVVVIEECAKILPPTSHNAVAGLMARFHISRLECFKKIKDAADDKIASIAKGEGENAGVVEITGETARKLFEALAPMMRRGVDNEEVEELDPEAKPDVAPTED